MIGNLNNKKKLISKVKYFPATVCFPEGGSPSVCMEAPFDSLEGFFAEVNKGIVFAIGFSALVGVAFLVYGGISFIIAGGDAEKIDKATKIITNTIIGMVLVFISILIINFILDEVLGGA